MRFLLALLLLVTVARGYTPPIGIPNPSTAFGWEIDRATPAWPASWTAGTPSATAGYYYVDKTAVGATNTSNTYGYPGHARLTPPEFAIAAGSFIYIHAGTYTPTDSNSDRFSFNGLGTSGSPVWITGNPTTHPILQDKTQIGNLQSSNFVILENIDFNRGTSVTGRIVIGPNAASTTVDHTLIRNCRLTGNQINGDSNAISIGGGAAVDRTTSNTVIYNCVISHYGVMTRTGSTEDCGVYKDFRSDSCWVLNCDISTVGADCVAGSHSANGTDAQSTRYYIGGNVLHESGENAIDLKGTRYVIISQNDCYGPFVREQGWAIVLHSGAVPATPVRDCWVIFNHLHHTTTGVATTSTNGSQDVAIVGNLINDMADSYGESTDPQDNGYGVFQSAMHGHCYCVNNTIYDCDRGIAIDVSGAETTNRATVYGNIVTGLKVAPTYTGYSVNSLSGGTNAWITQDYDFLPTSPIIGWEAGTRSLATLQGTYGQEIHVLTGDPLLVNPAGGNYGLQAGSTAIGTGLASLGGFSPYDTFQTMWGTSIAVDYNGGTRPAGGTWDKGAFEFGSSPGDSDSPTVTSIAVNSGGDTLTITFSEGTIRNNTTPTVSLSGGACTLTYSSGSGSASHAYSLSRTVYIGETGTLSATLAANAWEDAAGNDVATISASTITNGSLATPTPIGVGGRIAPFSTVQVHRRVR